MVLRRGFATQTVMLAHEVRQELGLGEYDPFDPYALATEYGIPVISFAELDCLAAVRHFTSCQRGKLSGLVIPIGTGRAIVENPTHDECRCRSTIGHEMGHVLLEHSFDVHLMDGDACRSGSPGQEEEATWLAGELLLPRDAARRVVFQDWPLEQVMHFYGISEQMAKWRLGISGGYQIRQRARTRRQTS
jgi:hypothetical protein